MAGDGYQNGGALVVGKNGETLFHYVQEGAPDHASNLDLLKVNFCSYQAIFYRYLSQWVCLLYGSGLASKY